MTLCNQIFNSGQRGHNKDSKQSSLSFFVLAEYVIFLYATPSIYCIYNFSPLLKKK